MADNQSSKLLNRGQWPLKLPIGFGGAAISGEGRGYGFGPMDETSAETLLKDAFEQGVRLYDFAPIYGHRLSEQRFGRYLSHVREQIFLISKCGVDWHDNGRVNMTNEPKVIQKQLEHSRQDFQTDTIDLYMVHWPDARVDIRKSLEVLAKAQERKWIRHIGLCNTSVDELKKAQEVAPIKVVQSELNIFNPNSYLDLEQTLVADQISFMSWGTLDKGILAGSVDAQRKFDPLDCRSWAPWWKKSPKDYKFSSAKRLKQLIDRTPSLEGWELVDLALAFNLSFLAVDCILCGPKSNSQLTRLIKALSHIDEVKNYPLSDELKSEILEIVDECRRHYSNL